MTTLLLFASILALSLLLQAVFLWLGARWMKAAKPMFYRALAATALMFMASILFLVASGWLRAPLNPGDLLLAFATWIAFLFVQIFVFCLIIQWVMRTSFWRAAIAWLVTLIPSVPMLALVFLIIRPYVVEAFVIPTFGMAPTLIGWHKSATCPHCGQMLLMPMPPPQEMLRGGPGELNPLGICSHCFQASSSEDQSSEILPPDRIIANKLLSPRRWDIIVFRFPRNPSIKYAMRLVGLPGEKVFIKDGAVWANGVRLSPPESIADLRYSTALESGASATMGSEDEPWVLKEDEFCVLGDFSVRASDSRFWGPVPRSNIEGVVTIRYWPISRWKLWR
jgi:signal peptidase I